MVSVVKQRPEAQVRLEANDRVGYGRLVPLMNNNNIGAVKVLACESRERIVSVIELDVEFRVHAAKIVDGLDGTLPLVAHQVRERPGSELLVASDAMAHANERLGQTAEKVRVSVVPVRDPGVSEIMDVQGLAHKTAAPAGRAPSRTGATAGARDLYSVR